MPNTCAMSSNKTVNFLQRIFNPMNRDKLKSLIVRSTENLSKRFFEPSSSYSQQHVAKQDLTQITSALEHMGHTQLLALFFGLLNIDVDMKEYIITMDAPENNRKLTRFYLDLNRRAVSAFYSNEEINTRQFVDTCEEMYVLA